MQLMLNDETIQVENNVTINELVEWLKTNQEFEQKSFAVAVNMEFVPRSIYAETVLKENDRVDIVLPMQSS